MASGRQTPEPPMFTSSNKENQAIIELSISLSSPTVSLSSSDAADPFYIIAGASLAYSAKPKSPLTIMCCRCLLDETLSHYYWGLGDFTCTTDPSKRLVDTHGSLRPQNRDEWGADLREEVIFRTIPPVGQGSFEIKHQITREAMKENTNVKPGEKYTIALKEPRSARMWWWVFGDLQGNLKGKKFWNPCSRVEPVPAEDWIVPELDDSDDSEQNLIKYDGDGSKVTLEIVE